MRKNSRIILTVVIWAICAMIANIGTAGPIFVVNGDVKNVGGDLIDGVSVTVKNLTKQIEDQTQTEDGLYTSTFVNFSDSVADVDDQIEISIIGENGEILAKVTKHLTQAEVDSTSIVIDVQIRPKPMITEIDPKNDLVFGGASITIKGENFQDGATIQIGDNLADNINFNSETEITAIVPSGVEGIKNIVLTNPDGRSVTLENAFTYNPPPPPPPILISIDPKESLITAGIEVTIKGDHFQDGAKIKFGEIDADQVTFVSTEELKAIAPAGEVGTVTITVTNPDDQISAETIEFTYNSPPPPAPIITAITPDNAQIIGGDEITIIGENFQNGVIVQFGEIVGTEIVFDSETEIRVTTPKSEFIGTIDLIVVNPDDQTAIAQFTFIEDRPDFRWDLNENGVVDIFDLVIVASEFGETGENLKGDVNSDGVVNIFDLVGIASNFGKTADQISAAPTPIIAIQTAINELEIAAKKDPKVLPILDLLRSWQISNDLVPNSTRLLQNFPNPFNPETWIPFELAKSSDVKVIIYNAIGEIVREIEVGHRSAGIYKNRSTAIHWDGRNNFGEIVPSGVYFYTLETEKNRSEMRKMIILK